MNGATDRICIWTGIVGAALIGIAFWPLAGFVPPPQPSATAAEIAAQYRGNAFGIIAACTLFISAFGLLVPFYAALSARLVKLEPAGMLLALAQFGLFVIALSMPGVVGTTLWMAAAFRAERSPEIIQLLNDIGWIIIFTPVVSGMLQVLVIAIGVFSDHDRATGFPRWYAYFNIWVGLLFLPAGLLGFFKTGLLAWDGLLAFWLGLADFGAWFVVTAVLLLRSSAGR